jgi:predicted transposase YbfD/YdcC
MGYSQMTLENANVTVDALSAMKSGQKSMKKLNKQMYTRSDRCC